MGSLLLVVKSGQLVHDQGDLIPLAMRLVAYFLFVFTVIEMSRQLERMGGTVTPATGTTFRSR